jgi:hypothetical protein
LNWVRLDKPVRETPPAAPQDWAFINPQDYFDWHDEFGVKVMFCQPCTSGGDAVTVTTGYHESGPIGERLCSL